MERAPSQAETESPDEGVVVFGFARSGTTLFRRLVDAHPSLACPPETHLLHAAGRFLEEEPISKGLSLGVVSGVAYAGIAPDDLYGRVRDMVFGVFADIARAQGKKRWVDKTPAAMFQIDAVEKLCADRCRFISLVRHPLDVICSLRELVNEIEIYSFEFHDYICAHPSPLDAFAHAWADTHARLLRFEADHADRCHRIRYEDLVANPAEEMGKVFAFLNERCDVEALVAGALKQQDTLGLGDWKTYRKASIDAASVGRRRELSPSTRARLLGIVGPAMEAYGYPIDMPTDLPEPERARELHRMALTTSRLLASARKPPK
jgi:protein-tyrosine sulfotransferase